MPYDHTQLAEPEQQVRLLAGDTDPEDPVFDDEEIEFFLAQENDNVYNAAALGLESLASVEAGVTSWAADGISVTRSKTELADRAAQLRKLATRGMSRGLPYFGGGSRSEREKDAADDDLIPLSIQSHQMDHPEVDYDRDWDDGITGDR